MTSKSIHNLIPDIYKLFDGHHEVSDDNLALFKETIGETIKEAVENAGVPREFSLRMSNIGSPDRKLWYQSRDNSVHKFQSKDHVKFLFGHMIEALLLFLAREAGHSVEKEQQEVSLEQVTGHIDCVIDGHVIDVKSASSFSFSKFVSGGILTDDPFGYCHQLSGYFETVNPEENEVGWLVADKQHGELALVTYENFELPSAKDRILHLKEVLESEEPPEKCYQPKEDKHGNEVLAKGCIYCPFKAKCWPDMRVFRYSTNDAFYTKVAKEPRVPEVTKEYFDGEK